MFSIKNLQLTGRAHRLLSRKGTVGLVWAFAHYALRCGIGEAGITANTLDVSANHVSIALQREGKLDSRLSACSFGSRVIYTTRDAIVDVVTGIALELQSRSKLIRAIVKNASSCGVGEVWVATDAFDVSR